MRPSDGPLFTPAEAAVLTRLSLEAVNNAIDKNLVPAVVRSATGDSGRFSINEGCSPWRWNTGLPTGSSPSFGAVSLIFELYELPPAN